jgi:hypothetical protein
MANNDDDEFNYIQSNIKHSIAQAQALGNLLEKMTNNNISNKSHNDSDSNMSISPKPQQDNDSNCSCDSCDDDDKVGNGPGQHLPDLVFLQPVLPPLQQTEPQPYPVNIAVKGNHMSQKQPFSRKEFVNGVSHDDIHKYIVTSKQVAGCSYCGLYYELGKYNDATKSYEGGMISTSYDPEGSPVCFHCIFTMNYLPVDTRLNFDGTFGKTVVDYILDCAEFHDTASCTRTNACFVCDYMKNKKIENIFNAEQLFTQFNEDESPQSEDSPDYESIRIKVTI